MVQIRQRNFEYAAHFRFAANDGLTPISFVANVLTARTSRKGGEKICKTKSNYKLKNWKSALRLTQMASSAMKASPEIKATVCKAMKDSLAIRAVTNSLTQPPARPCRPASLADDLLNGPRLFFDTAAVRY